MRRPPLKKRFGQHFLRDEALLARIAAATRARAGDAVLEIGAGDGVLTAHLAQTGAAVTALEVDARFAERLRARFADNARVRIVHADALAADWQRLLVRAANAEENGGARILAGNLPYNISSPLLLKMARESARWARCVVMVQKEVGERVCAPPGAAAYGRLSVSLQARFATQLLFSAPPAAFVPPPAVESAVALLTPLAQPIDASPAFEAVLSAAFGARRKTLKNALARLTAGEWDGCPVDARRRAQELHPAQFAALARWLGKRV